MPEFPHFGGNDFPHIDNVNVNKWVNDFDYSRYDYTQMRITVCTVPWDMGEAHIGARTISGIGNVVYFESKAKRDEWFAAIPDSDCFRFETKYKALHSDLYLDIPLPFDIASKYNYMMVEYSQFANDSSPVMYESADGHRKWFWFIREVEFIAPNTTRVHILADAWQTWIYDVDVTGMMLERGHAPMFATKVANYLANPIANNSNLLAPDVDYGSASIAKSSSEFVFNSGDMYALIFTTAFVRGTWGTKSAGTWQVPGVNGFSTEQGLPDYYVIACAANYLSDLLDAATSDMPQFLQTIKCVAFVSKDLVTLSTTPFVFNDVNCYLVDAVYKKNQLIKLSKSMFGYDSKYADIAKLYTYPYAVLEICDETGNMTEVRIEETSGTIDIESNVSLVFPWLNISAHLSGIGKTTRHSVTFKNISSRTMPIQGNWYETLMTWNIPTFGIVQDAGTNNDYATHFDRVQQQTAANNELASANASAATAQANAQETADTLVDNADITADTNTATTDRSNTALYYTSSYQYSYNNEIRDADNQATSDGATATTAANEQQAAITAASGAATGVTSAVGSLARGDIAGAVSSLANAAIGGVSTMASTSVGVALTQAQVGIAQTTNNAHTFWANDFQEHRTDITQSAQSDIADAQNDMTTGTAANSAACTYANAARDYTTDTANATRRYNTAVAAIGNQIAQAKLNAPLEFGAWNAGDHAASRPLGLFANVVTQNDGAIALAGDEMLRYGYMYNRAWEFDGNWNIGKKFTYWKLKDFWVSNLNVPDMYMDSLRFFLFGGVTVWRNPADIGKTSIYDN